MESDTSGRNEGMWIIVVSGVLLGLSIVNNVYQKRKTYCMIDRLLDSVLNQETIEDSDVKEGEYSALVSKIKQIQEVLGSHIQSAEQVNEGFCTCKPAFRKGGHIFGIADYQTISISVNSEKESKEVSETIGKITRKINKCVVKDYSEQIRQQNLYLFQKMFFYYGIAAVLLGISILHMINSMQYLIAAGAEYWNLC